ncbi:MAG: hypothetical protein H6706_13070 [Myxococcales bacterium]|nr:hypothetical protein [Myxococcales bacterium]
MKAWMALVALVALGGCDDDDGGGAADAARTLDRGAQADAARADAAQADAARPDAAQPDAAQPDAARPDAAMPDAALPDAGAPACLDPALCFSNGDCPANALCLNVAPEGEDEAPCCVPGARGDAPTGADCSAVDGQRFCASGVCIEGDAGSFCSVRCDDVECPAPFVRCVAIPLEGGVEAWCFP